ncbi:MAG: formyltetrahydrofolate deformylase [Acidimicrobiales bacterium]|nr:formyltetrahydrofolate deformylase [Acidimicrobiales bacterium]
MLRLVCPDDSGIVLAVATWVAGVGGNIVDASQTSDTANGLFLQRVELSHPQPAAQLRCSFAAVADRWTMTWALDAPHATARLAVLVSRTGHCLSDLLGRCALGDLPGTVELVVSDVGDLAPTAAHFEVPYRHRPIDAARVEGRAEQEAAVLADLRALSPDLVVLARYMRVLSPAYCEEFGARTINIHHSFLPAFRGADAYRQAWERGVKLIGATAHYVTADLDEGPIIAQDVARLTRGDGPVSMARRGRDLEATVLATAVRAHLEHRVISYAGRTVVFD